MAQNDAAVRKRAQITQTNRTMFVWIAVASALIGAGIVVGIFLVQRLVYNEAVLAKKQETITTLNHNLNSVDDLKQEIRKLDVNSALLSARASDEDQAVRVILDALPSEANSLALGASLQSKLLKGIDGLTIESLQVDPVYGVEVISDGGSSQVIDSGSAASEITFNFTVSGSQDALKKALVNLERSLRTISITSLRIDGQPGGNQEMNVQGRAFYEPAREIQFSEVSV